VRWWNKERPEIILEACKSFLHTMSGEYKGGLTINPYQGCYHRCVYCYATYDWFQDFYDKVKVKINAPKILNGELKGIKGPILISSSTDCYQPIENIFKVTRRCIEILISKNIPFIIITKSSSVVRDFPLLAKAKDLATIVWSLTTLDEKVKRILEPFTSSAKGIIRAMRKAKDYNLRFGVNIDPIIPKVNDDVKMLMALVDIAKDCGSKFVAGGILRLRKDIFDRIKELFLSLGWKEKLDFIERVYFERPRMLKGYLLASKIYEDRILNFLKRYTEEKGLIYGFPNLYSIREVPQLLLDVYT